MLATSARCLPPHLEQWAVEPQVDGMRAQLRIHRGQLTAWSKTGRDVTVSFPELVCIAQYAWRRTLLLDGELIVLTGQ